MPTGSRPRPEHPASCTLPGSARPSWNGTGRGSTTTSPTWAPCRTATRSGRTTAAEGSRRRKRRRRSRRTRRAPTASAGTSPTSASWSTKVPATTTSSGLARAPTWPRSGTTIPAFPPTSGTRPWSVPGTCGPWPRPTACAGGCCRRTRSPPPAPSIHSTSRSGTPGAKNTSPIRAARPAPRAASSARLEAPAACAGSGEPRRRTSETGVSRKTSIPGTRRSSTCTPTHASPTGARRAPTSCSLRDSSPRGSPSRAGTEAPA